MIGWRAPTRSYCPQPWKALSLVLLESLGLGVPVLVNGGCDVTRGHCQRSNGGLYYYQLRRIRGRADAALDAAGPTRAARPAGSTLRPGELRLGSRGAAVCGLAEVDR